MGSSGDTMWEKEEDKVLAWSWVAASEDSITLPSQKAIKFLGRVFEIYVVLIPDGKERTSIAYPAQWGTINQDITKFCGLFEQVTRSVPKSGWTEDKYIEEAMKLFKLEGKGKRLRKEFIFDVYWRILKEAMKWKGGCGYVWDHSKLKLDGLK